MSNPFETGFQRDIAPKAPKQKETIPLLAGTAAILALIGAFNQDIKDTSAPQHKEQPELAQQPPESPVTQLEYNRIRQTLDEIFEFVEYLPHTSRVVPQGSRYQQGQITHREIPSIKVREQIYKLETEYIECGYGVDRQGRCKQQISVGSSRNYKAPRKISLTNSTYNVIYELTSDEVANKRLVRSVYNLREPKIIDNKTVPNHLAGITGTYDHGGHSSSPFDIPSPPMWKFRGQNFQTMESKLNGLHSSLKSLVDAKKAREAAAEQRAIDES